MRKLENYKRAPNVRKLGEYLVSRAEFDKYWKLAMNELEYENILKVDYATIIEVMLELYRRDHNLKEQ